MKKTAPIVTKPFDPAIFSSDVLTDQKKFYHVLIGYSCNGSLEIGLTSSEEIIHCNTLNLLATIISKEIEAQLEHTQHYSCRESAVHGQGVYELVIADALVEN